MCGKVLLQECEAAGRSHYSHTQEAERNAVAQFILSIAFSPGPQPSMAVTHSLVGPSLLQLTWSRSSSHFLGDSSVVCLPGNHIRLAFKIAHWPEVHQFGLGWPARSPKDPLVLVTPALDSKCTPPHLSVSAHACEYMHTHA